MKNVRIEQKKNRPITNGAIPNWKELQKISLATKNPMATKRLNIEIENPAIVIKRSGTFEWFVIPSIAKSNNVKKLFLVIPRARLG